MKARKLIKAFVWLLLCMYGVVFVLEYWSGHEGRGVGNPVVAQATDITCRPNWLVLGLRSRCTATIVANDGKRYSFSNGASLLTPEDVGKPVPMVRLEWRKGRGSSWIPARDDFDPKPWPGGLTLLFTVAGIVGGLVMVSKKEKTAPA